MSIKPIFVALSVALFGACNTPTVETFTEAADPVALTTEQAEAWNSVKSGVNAAWASCDFVY